MSQTNRRNCTEAFVVETVEEVKTQILDIIVVEINKSVDLLKTKIIDNLVKENKRLYLKKKMINFMIEYSTLK